MDSPIKAVQAPYRGGGSASYRTPPPDLSSLLLKERIVYLGMPLAPDVAQLIIAELLYLQYDDPEKPITIYINSAGEYPGLETSAFAICDTMSYIKPPIQTICLGAAFGMSAMILSAGTKGYRMSLPHAEIMLRDTSGNARGQATDIQIRAQEVIANRQTMIDVLSANTGRAPEQIRKDIDRVFFMSPEEAIEYGLIDKILENKKELNSTVASGIG